MKKLKQILLLTLTFLFCQFSFGQITFSKDNMVQIQTVKSYQIIYITENQYMVEMKSNDLADDLLWSYYLNSNNELYPLFNSVEQAMGNMRGFHKRDFQDPIDGNNYLIYVLSDFCCGDNGNFPNLITLMSDNEIRSSH